jgi:hypothetical protein
MMSRQISFQDIANTISHRAPKRKCETDTDQGNFCAIGTISSLLFFNREMKYMQYLVDIFAVFHMLLYYFNTSVYVFSPISLFIKFTMIFFL